MTYLEFGCLPTVIGSMPHTDPEKAGALGNRFLKDIPSWPQLPNRSFLENMYVQYSQGFPGVVLELEEDRIYINRSQGLDKPLEELYAAYLENDADKYPIGPEYAAGLHSFLALNNQSPRAVKGHVTGPISWGLTVTDQDRRSIAYDDVLGDAVAKLLRLKAGWQEKALRKISSNTIIFVDEPYMASFGSAFFSLTEERVISLLEEVFAGIRGLKGLHCCGNTDWSVLLKTSVDILHVDTYNYAESLSLYPFEIKEFLGRRGAVAWGIVPNDADALAGETVASLKDRLEEAMAPFTRNGIPFRQLIEQGLLTPSCGLAPLTEEAAERALELLTGLSETIRRKHG
ncbi:methionine synthase [Chloroflexota bacterium]